MKRYVSNQTGFVSFLLTAMLMVVALSMWASTAVADEPTPKADTAVVEEALLAEMEANGRASYLIYFKDAVDFSPAYDMDWEARGQYVMRTLQEAAQASQKDVRAYLDNEGVSYQAFWIDNIIVVESSDITVLNNLLSFNEIASIRAEVENYLIEPEEAVVTGETALNALLAPESNLVQVKATDTWALGFRGEGIVIANIDSGVRYTHEALVNQYRGNLGGGNFDHNYNWLDPDGGSATPVDGNGHGTHVMGTMVGYDGGANEIGVAPDAEWIACRGCLTSSCPATALLACAEWIAAPYPIGNPGSPDPSMRPLAVNNSWGDCGQSYDPWYQGVVDAWHAAGVYPVFANGNASNCGYNAPPGLNTVGNPGRYGSVTGVGSSGTNNGAYATHSNWGPTDNLDVINPQPGWADLKPQVLAPGVNIRSSVPSSDSAYQSSGWTGTSMSAPHVTGMIALMVQAAPCLAGDYATLETIIEESATPIQYDDGSGPRWPNYATGWGEIDVLAAVNQAIAMCGDFQMQVTPSSQAVCTPTDVVYDVALLLNEPGFDDPVTLSVVGAPAGYTPAFDTNPVSVPGTSELTLSGSALFGSYEFDVVGTAVTQTMTATVGLDVYTAVPTVPTLTGPADGAVDVPLRPTFSWDAATQSASYMLEVATDMGFSNVVYTATVEGTSHAMSDYNLDPDTDYYWRVNATNICGDSAYSATYSFTTVLLFCSYPALPIIDNTTVSDSLIVNQAGTLSDLNVYMQANHTFVGDLVVTLTNEATNTTVELIPGSFSCSADDIDATFDDESGNPLTCGSNPAIGGDVQPAGSLADFDFNAVTGTWRIDVTDTAGGDEGTLNEWCLVPSFATAVGTVAGTVTDANTNAPITSADLTFDDGSLTYQAMTDGNGDYVRPLPTGTFTVTVMANNYVTEVAAGVNVSDGVTTTLDFALDAGQLASSATGFDVTVNLGDSTTENWTLENIGSSTVTLEINARADGYAPSLNNVLAGEDILIVNDGGFNTDQSNAMATAVSNLGYTYAIVNSATFAATDVADLLQHQAVLYAGIVSSGVEQAKAMEYMDAGGSFLVADNDLGWDNRTTPSVFYATYLQAVYSTDAGSDGVLTGVDIMAGLNPDISSDPFPDDFTVESDGVEIFTAPSNNSAGSRIEREGYKAIYLAWDYHHAGGSAVGDQIETDIMEAALNWLVGGTAEWLSTDVLTATLPIGGDEAIVVTMDAGQVALPGIYYGSLNVRNDTPYGDLVVPVTMTVACPNCGTVAGDITDALSGDPVAASVQITDTNGFDITLEGTSYSFPLLPGTYYLTASATDYFSDTAMINISTGVTTTQDFALTPIFAELVYSPSGIEEDMEIGDIVTNTVTVTNTGTSELTFDVSVGNFGGPAILAVRPVATSQNVVGSTTRTFSGNLPADASAAELADADTSATDKIDLRDAPALTNFQWPTSSAVLYDNGPLVNCVGCGVGGADESVLQVTSLGLTSLGVGHQVSANNRVADEFEVTGGGWTLDTVTFFAYQTGSSATSTITAVNLRIWDGPPNDVNSNVVFGDPFTNRMISTGWSNIYRVTDTTTGVATDRPIMASVVDLQGLFLPAGTYWLDWQADGSLASGPWAPPITIDGETTTGNALQFTGNTASWQPLVDGGTNTPQGMPFVIAGSGGGSGPWASATPNSGTVPAGDSVTFEVVFDATGVTQVGTFTAELSFSGNFVNNPASMPLTMNITCPTCGILDGTVTDADSGDPVNATIALEGNGVSTSVTGSTYEFAVPAGTYTLTVTADDYVGDTAVVTANTGQTTTTDFALRLDAPNISADPTSLHATLLFGDSMTQTLTIQNDGAAGTDFTITEIEVVGLMNAPLADIIADGSFEADPATGPWTETDTTGCIPWIGDWFSIVGVSAYDGTQYYWAGGGCNAAANSNSAAQTITIPNGMAELTFWYHAQRNDPDDPTDNGQAYIQLDGSDVWTLVTNQANNTTGWTEVTVDVSAYAGQTVELTVGLDQGASGFANVFFDALSIEAAADVPWLATDPVTGTVAADSMTDVTVLFDTSVLTQTGSFSAILELASDDANSPLAVPVYLTVTAPTAALELDVTVSMANECGTADSLEVLEGSVVYYCYTVQNTGEAMLPNHIITDTVFGHIDTFVYDLHPGMSESVIYSQTVTSTADSTVMWEASHAGFGVSAMATDTVTVTVVPPAEYGVDLSADVTMLTGTLGSTVTYTVSIENTGNVSSGFMLEVLSAGWTTSLMTDTLVLDAGEMQTFEVYVTVPLTATDGEMDTAVIQATSAVGRLLNNQVDTIELTTTAEAEDPEPTEYINYLPIVVRP